MRITRNELRLAARSFTRHPGFAITAVLSLALAIALNTTMYSVIDALVRPKVDMQDPTQLYRLIIWGDARQRVDQATRASLLTTGFGVYESATFTLRSSTMDAELGRRFTEASVSVVAPNYFITLGIRPKAGRVFVDGDFAGQAGPLVVSERLVAALFRDGEQPIGAIIDLDGEPHPIIGVIGKASQFPGGTTDAWMLPPPGTQLSAIPFNVLRLRQGISAQAADHQLHVLSDRFAALAGESPKDAWFQLVPAWTPQFHYQGFHYALIAAVVAVLLVACANLANLQLARGIGRSRELALRSALGASRRDIVTQLVLESSLLAAAGLLAGLVLTYWGVDLLSARIPPSVSDYVVAPQTSWRVFAFAMGASLLCVMLVGLLPAIRVSRVDPNELLKAGAGTGANRRSRRQYGVMVIVEIGLSLALLSGAGVVVHSALRVSKVKPEYDPKPLSTAWLILRPPHDTVVRSAAVEGQLLSTIRSLPDVADVAAAFGRGVENDSLTVNDAGGGSRGVAAPMFRYVVASPSYFRTFNIPVLKGRQFLDGGLGESEAIVDQTTARLLWPGIDAVGQLVKLGSPRSNSAWVRVVGVVPAAPDESDLSMQSHEFDSRNASRLGQIYVAPAMSDSVALSKSHPLILYLTVRSKTEPDRMPVTLRHALPRAREATLRAIGINRMEDALGIDRERQRHDFVAATFTSFAALAIALACLGIYGIVAHSVAERRRELGVRIALGATDRNILHAVLREGNPIALAGVAVGLLFTKYTFTWLRAFAYADDEHNAPLFAALALVLFVVAVFSAFLPALRATQIDPVESLRSE